MSSDPFWWLRLLLIALITLVSVVFGVEPSFDPQTATIGDLIGVLFDTTEDGIEANGGIEALSESIAQGDEELGEVTDVPLTELPPLDDEETPPGGGVIGGGESEGPDPIGTEPPTATTAPNPTATIALPPPTATEIAPTATVIATLTPTTPPTETPQPTATVTATTAPTATPDPAALRLDDPVLRWLPELRAASQATGVPAALLAALVRVESSGDPNLIAADGGRGLAGVPESALQSQGVPANAWHDPATNLIAAGRWIAGLQSAAGSIDAALGAAWGPTCDTLGQCAGLFAYAVQAWQGVYSPLIANPTDSGLPVLPPTWTPPPLAPFQETSPRRIPLPSGVSAPTPTATPEPTATQTPEPTATEAPTETPPPTATVEPTATFEGAAASPAG